MSDAATPAAQWHYARCGVQHGPVSGEELARLIREKGLTENDLVWTPGMPAWGKAGETPGAYFRLRAGESGTIASARAQPVPAAAAKPTPAKSVSLSPPATANYFARHWRGDLSLGVSYWVNGLLVTLFASISGTMLGELNVVAHPSLYSWFAVGYLAGVLPAVTIWQFVGIWRSALRPPLTRICTKHPTLA